MFLACYLQFGLKMATYFAETWPGCPLKCERVRTALGEHIKKAQPG
jgi:hypothetical protein